MKDGYDLVVVGAGAAGMSAALTADELGLSVLLIEKTPYIGGSTAYSGGATWIPNNPHQIAAGAAEPEGEALRYLEAEIGNYGNPSLWQAFLKAGPEMVRFMEAKTRLKFSVRAVAPDYHPEQPGAALGYRVLDPLDFDARVLGDKLSLIRPPIPEFTVFGGMMVGRADIPALFNMFRRPAAMGHSLRILARHLRDRLFHGRATRLVLGAAMAGRLAASVFERGIDESCETELTGLILGDGKVGGVRVRVGGAERQITARRGVVLAGGGAPRANALDAQLHPHGDHWSMSPAGSTGDSIALTKPLGVAPNLAQAEPLFYAPVSLLPGSDGAVRPFPHLFLDRAKPGIWAVDETGQRFVNEAASYHDFVQAMLGRGQPGAPESGEVRAPQGAIWLVTDHRAIRRYGLGAVRPFPAPIGRHLRSGYLRSGRDARDLAEKTGIDPAGLEKTIASTKRYAAKGHDPDFGKGSTEYNRYLGDPENAPNPCLGPLETPPFYAIRLYPGDIGASIGLPIDEYARVLDENGAPVPGLFACGNDAASIMGGMYPAAGITLGPALTFGFIAAHSAAGAVRNDRTFAEAGTLRLVLKRLS